MTICLKAMMYSISLAISEDDVHYHHDLQLEISRDATLGPTGHSKEEVGSRRQFFYIFLKIGLKA